MVGTPAKPLWLGFAFLTLAPLIRAQKPSAIPLVPAADWHLVSSRTAGVDSVRQFGGDPAVEREYGVDSLEIRNYSLHDASVEAVVEASPDASTSFGLLTYYRSDAMTPAPGMSLAVIGPGGGLMARGHYFFRIPRASETASKISENEFLALMFLLVGSHPTSRESALLPDALPRSGLIPGSAKYLLGPEAARHVLPHFRTDLIGFSQGAEVQMGAYSTGGGHATVLAITYPTPQIARARYGEMESILALNQDHGPGSVFGRRLGSFIIVVVDANSAATAKSLTEAFTMSGRVVQNEPYPGDQPITVQMMQLIIGNLLFVFFLAGIAIGGGLLVFVSKRVARRWFSESDWVEGEEGTLTVLRLS